MPESKDQSDVDMERLKEAASALGEHFDSVQIFCTRLNDDSKNTVNASTGVGNWFARYGQVKEWIIKEEERSKQECKPEDS